MHRAAWLGLKHGESSPKAPYMTTQKATGKERRTGRTPAKAGAANANSTAPPCIEHLKANHGYRY